MINTVIKVITAVAATVTFAGAASAAKPVPPVTPKNTLQLGATACGFGDISPTASACSGWYVGNLNGQSPAMNDASAQALNALLGVSTYSGSNLTFLEGLDSLSGSTIDFAKPLYGTTILSVHVGAAKGQSSGIGYQGTAFYKFDAGNSVGGLNTITFNRAGLSNARLYSTGELVPTAPVPEPSTWAMMFVGAGAAGYAARRRKARAQTAQG